MSKTQESGDAGELDVVEKVPCPNCKKKLMILPKNYPLYDVQCVGCNFRAQVKTNNNKPKNQIFGATWDIMDKVLKAGFITPPLITNFIWEDKTGQHQEVYFYPFVPKANLKKYFTTIKKSGRELWMFNYIDINELPRFVLYKK